MPELYDKIDVAAKKLTSRTAFDRSQNTFKQTNKQTNKVLYQAN